MDGLQLFQLHGSNNSLPTPSAGEGFYRVLPGANDVLVRATANVDGATVSGTITGTGSGETLARQAIAIALLFGA